MPYKSKKQAAFIHAEADRGTSWAKKFVADAHGTHVGDSEPVKRSFKGKRKNGGVHHPFPKRAAS
jgi:hypothetical protein